MKKISKICVLLLTFAFLLTGCGSYVPKEWYTGNINYYKLGFSDGWKNEEADFNVCEEMKDPNNKFGYLLVDLDGDGGEELLIGIIDDSPATKFTDLIIYHRDFGPTRSFRAGDGYYFYLCAGNIIKMDSWYGSQTKTDYMQYDSKENSFPIVDSAPTPLKVELTPF